MKLNFTKKLLCLVISVFTISAMAQCPPITSFSITYGPNGTTIVTPVITGSLSPTQKYFWGGTPGISIVSSFYDPNGLIQFPSNGDYTVCLSIFDTVSFCGSSFCDTLTIDNIAFSCHADFTYTDTNCVTHFINTSTGTNLTYEWYDGIAMFSTQQNPVFALSQGPHTIVLYTYSNDFSTTMYCDSISHFFVVNCTDTITPPPTPCHAGFTWFVDSIHNDCLTHFINQSTGDNITTYFNIDNQGEYPFVSEFGAALSNGIHTMIVKTYSNGLFCDSVYGSIVVNCDTVFDHTACQAGFVSFSDPSSPGNYSAYNTSVGNYLNYIWDFGDGTTSTLQYPFHTYNIPGDYTICLTAYYGVCSTTYCDSVKGISTFHILSEQITSVNELKNPEMKVYPNPMSDILSFETEASKHSEMHYRLTDAIGRLVSSGKIIHSKTEINTSGLEQGFYNLSILNQEGSVLKSQKLVK